MYNSIRDFRKNTKDDNNPKSEDKKDTFKKDFKKDYNGKPNFKKPNNNSYAVTKKLQDLTEIVQKLEKGIRTFIVVKQNTIPLERQLSLIRGYVYSTLACVYDLPLNGVKEYVKETVKLVQNENESKTSTIIIAELRKNHSEVLNELAARATAAMIAATAGGTKKRTADKKTQTTDTKTPVAEQEAKEVTETKESTEKTE